MFTIDSGFSNETQTCCLSPMVSALLSLSVIAKPCPTSNCGSIVTKSGQNHLQLQNPPRDPWPTPALLFSRLLLSFCTHCVLHIIHCVLHSGSHCFIVFDTGWRKILWFSTGKFRFIQKTCGDEYWRKISSSGQQWYQYFNNVSTMVSFFPLNNNGIWFHFLFPAEKVSGLVQNFWIHSHRIFVRMNIYVK